MRLGFSILLVALSTPLVLSSSYGEAQVYLFPSDRLQHHTPPSLDAGEANAAIAQHLGFDVYETLGGSQDGALVGGHIPGPNGMGVGVGEGELDSVLVVVQSAYPQDFIPKDLKPAFTISSPPPAEAFTDLIHAYTERAHQIFDNVISPFIASVQASPAYKQLLDAFDFVGDVGKDLAEELGRLVGVVDDGQKTVGDGKDTFEAVEVKLADLEKSYGRQSEVYGQAAQTVQAVLSNQGFQKRNVAIIVVPPGSPHISTKNTLHRRSDISQPALSSSNNKVVFSVSTCFTSNDTCSEATNKCSGHGTCNAVTIAGKTCYTCSCAITKNDQGRRQWWGGQSCERLDLSTPFTLLAGSGLVLIILVVFSVSLLQSVGAETLPNTLTAAASVGHPKRD